MYDSIIIGKGPSGISAAIYLKRSNKNVLVIGKDNGSLYDGVVIDNYYGFPGGISGTDLIARGVQQAESFGIEVLQDEVIALDKLEHFTVTLKSGKVFEGKTVLLATGKPRTTLRIKGFQQYKGKGISFCVTCDGFFFRRKKLALIGYNEYMLHELKDMEFLTEDITIFTNGNPLTVHVEYPVVDEPILEIKGDEARATSILTASSDHPVDGIFVALGSPGAVEFATRIGAIVEGSNILVNDDFETNIEGLYAAGDTVGGVLQVAKAAADGMHAAIAIKKQIKK